MAEYAPNLEEMISYRVARLQSMLNRQAAAILKRHGLAQSQWRILVMLEALGRSTTSEISRKTGFDKAMLSRAIQAMVARGLVHSHPSDQNRSHIILSLTDAGREAYEQARPFMKARHDALLGCMSDTERETLYSAFAKLEDYLSEALGDAALSKPDLTVRETSKG